MTLNEFCSLTGGDRKAAVINVYKEGNHDSNAKIKEFAFQSFRPAEEILRAEYANAEVIAFWAVEKDVFDVEIEMHAQTQSQTVGGENDE